MKLVFAERAARIRTIQKGASGVWRRNGRAILRISHDATPGRPASIVEPVGRSVFSSLNSFQDPAGEGESRAAP